MRTLFKVKILPQFRRYFYEPFVNKPDYRVRCIIIFESLVFRVCQSYRQKVGIYNNYYISKTEKNCIID